MGNTWFWWDIILVTEAALLVVGGIGFFAARKRLGNFHHGAMLVATAVVVIWVMAYMLMSLIAGYTHFGGSSQVYYYAFIPLILLHSLLSTVALFLCYASVSLGFKSTVKENGERRLVEGSEAANRHKKVGLLTYWFFAGSAVTAFTAYAMLYFYYRG